VQLTTTEYNRAYKAQQRALARKAGLCGDCCERYPSGGKATCNQCLARRAKARRKARRLAKKAKG